MGCVGSDVEDELHQGSSSIISKRFKISKKSCNDYMTNVDYASVPRKLRSAIKKRKNGLISPDFRIPKKKPICTNEGTGRPRNDGLKKFKRQHISDGSVSEVVVQPTKDEEEVAEALYALAGMFQMVTENKTPLEVQPSETKSTAFPPESDGSRPGVEEAIQEEEVALTHIHSSSSGGSAEECVRIQSLDDGSQPERSLGIQPELTLASGGNSDRVFKLGDIIGGQHELPSTASENRSNVWPGVSSTEARNSDTKGPFLQSSASKFQDIFPNEIGFQLLQSLENSATVEPDAQDRYDLSKSWKRCCIHVNISCLIKGLQGTERADTLQMQSTQSKTLKALTERSDHLYGNSNSAHIQNTLPRDHQLTCNNLALCTAAERNPSAVLVHTRLVQDPRQASTNSKVFSKTENTALLHKRLLQDQQATAATSRLYALQKQNLEFFPLPGGGARGETTHDTARADTSIRTMAQLHIPYHKSKSNLDIPFLLWQNCYSSSSSVSHRREAAAALEAQLPPYQGGSSSYAPSPVGVAASSKHQAWKQHHYWSHQLVARCKSGHVTPLTVQNSGDKVQNSSPAQLQHSQTLFPRLHSSTEALGSNYTPHQQQPSPFISQSLPPSRVQGQHHQIPYAYQGNGGRHHPKSVPPLQLF